MLDLEGLQVAYLAHLMPHYLDLETGEVIDVYPGQPHPDDPVRYRRIPSRTDESEAEDRRAFAAAHPQLGPYVDDASTFRRAVSMDRSIEKGWYNFKNERATKAIEEWLETLGL
jgi:hypothetical protein